MAEMINDDTLHANYATCVIVDKPEDDVISSCSDDDGNDSDDMELVEETDAEVTQDGKRKATDDEDKSVVSNLLKKDLNIFMILFKIEKEKNQIQSSSTDAQVICSRTKRCVYGSIRVCCEKSKD